MPEDSKETQVDETAGNGSDDAGGIAAGGGDTGQASGQGALVAGSEAVGDGENQPVQEIQLVEVAALGDELREDVVQEIHVVNTSLVLLIIAIFLCAGAICVTTLLHSFEVKR